MTPEKIAQRFSFDRPGYKLIDFLEVGLPVYRLSLLATFLEDQPVPVLHEFILRAIELGLGCDKEIGEFLGLDMSLLVGVLADLDSAELISVSPASAGVTSQIALTAKGTKSVALLSTRTPKLGEIVLHFDGLTRRLVPPRSEPLWPYRQLVVAGIREVSSRPPRRPKLEDISIADARRISNLLSESRGRAKRELLSIKVIENSNRMFQVAQLLLYRSLEGNDSDFSVIVDEKNSTTHKDAIVRAGGLRRFGIDTEEQAAPPAFSVVDELSAEQLRQLTVQSAEASEAVREAILAATEIATPEGDSQADAIDRAILDSFAQNKAHSIRYLEVYEHPQFLDDALDNCRSWLLIISPWIKRQVLDQARLTVLKQRLEEGVKIYIGWGFGKGDRSNSNDMQVVQQLKSFKNSYHNCYFLDLMNTHEKILIKDSEYVITTSFNWLSFRGDRKRTLRYERGVYIGIRELVDEQFEQLVTRFEGAKQTTPSAEQLAALKDKFSPSTG